MYVYFNTSQVGTYNTLVWDLWFTKNTLVSDSALKVMWLHYSLHVYCSIFQALAPALVQNFTATVDAHTPSIVLNWDPPHDKQSKTGDPVIQYDIRFKPEKEDCYSETTVTPPTTSLVVGRDLGLKPLLKYSFEVRPRNEYFGGMWETVMEYVGKKYRLSMSTLIAL